MVVGGSQQETLDPEPSDQSIVITSQSYRRLVTAQIAQW
ncbi:unnamed protein product [Schistosoma margrebowiei]|uniref:Uncharacterized protein n=1 Tax=Schistosoma margrebowiei TaxID=48269 RepID=A0A183LK07_9TREM|nr:unnamed protein product [Schistosoma margrebowiei]